MIVLASKSASRRAMLEAAGVAFRCEPADLDERRIEDGAAGAPPGGIARLLAEAKALAIDAHEPVLGSDSLVSVAGRRFDKPRSAEEAAEHLRFFSGQAMRLHSAVALARDGAITWQHGECAELVVRPLSEDFIEAYLTAEWPEVGACVGVFRIEGLGELLELDGRPKWRFSGSVNWGNGPVDISVFANYVGEVWNTSVSRDVPIVSDDPNANFYRVGDFLTINTAISYTFEDGALDGTRIRLGVNNLFDKDPPLADDTYGFFSALHSPRGRVFRVDIRKTF